MTSETIDPFDIIHPSLGPMRGLLATSHVAQFRCIPFARIPARFRQSVVLDSLQGQTDFTRFGNACPAQDQGVGHPGGPLGGPIPFETFREFDEFDCLNCTVSTPVSVFDRDASNEKLPVLIYIHGGAFKEGAGPCSRVHDGKFLADTSVTEGHPVVVVSISYRLNWQGFLACQDLLDDAAKHGEPACNYGFYDQRNAFYWLRKYIAGFGGDADNITVFGESAGGWSIILHIDSTEPLFRRAIIESGVTGIVPPDPLEVKEKEYLGLLEYCGISNDDPERLAKLRAVPIETIVESIPKLSPDVHNLMADFTLFPIAPTYSNQAEIFASCKWLDALIIGDTYHEGYMWMEALQKNHSLEKHMLMFEEFFGPDAGTILDAYQISRNMDPNLFFTRCSFLMGDLLFSQPIHVLARQLSANTHLDKKIYRYNLTLRNPFPGSMYHSVAGHHFVDVLYVFGTLDFRFPWEYQRQQAASMRKTWTRFAAGLEPWDEYRADGEKIAILGGSSGVWEIRTREEDEKLSCQSVEGPRRYAAWETLDKLYRRVGEEKAMKLVDKWITKGQ